MLTGTTMGYVVVDNLKGFTQHRPPLVVFMICLGLFAIALLSMAYYIKLNDVQNSDVSQNWNNFLEQLSKIDFCITNGTDKGAITSTTKVQSTVSPSSNHVKKSLETTTLSRPDGDLYKNYSMPLMLTITPTPNFLQIHHNITHVSGTVYGKQLGLQGDDADEPINVTAELPYAWNISQCDSLKCKTMKFYTCVHFSAAADVFPTGGNPQVCQTLLHEGGVEYHVRMKTRDHKDHPLPYYYCKSMPIVNVDYKFDPKLTVMLSLEDRSVINLHLLHTSYFLFVMVIMLFCYALLRGRPNNKLPTDKAPLNS